MESGGNNKAKNGSYSSLIWGTAGITVAVAAVSAAILGNCQRKKRQHVEIVNLWEHTDPAIDNNISMDEPVNNDILKELGDKLTRDEDEDDDSRACIICAERKRKVLMLPCEHMILCVECAIVFFDKSIRCPECRKNVFKVHVPY